MNYLVLRRLDRRELAWVTIPALTFFFALGIYAFGASTKGARSPSIVSRSCGSPPRRARAEVQAFYGIFTPSRGTRDFRLATNALFTGFSQSGFGHFGELGNDVRFDQGTSGGVRQASFAQWTQRTVAAQGTVDPVPLAIRAELRWVGTKLWGRSRTPRNEALEDGPWSTTTPISDVGSLAPGASRSVDWTPVARVRQGRLTIAAASARWFISTARAAILTAGRAQPGHHRAAGRWLDALSGSCSTLATGHSARICTERHRTIRPRRAPRRLAPTPTPRPDADPARHSPRRDIASTHASSGRCNSSSGARYAAGTADRCRANASVRRW